MKIVILLVLCVLTFQAHLSYRNKAGQGTYHVTSNSLNEQGLNGIEVTFGNGKVSFNGCNFNHGSYKEQPGNLVEFSDAWVVTRKFCPDDNDGLLRIQFEDTKSYTLNGNKLELQNEFGETILTLELVAQ